MNLARGGRKVSRKNNTISSALVRYIRHYLCFISLINMIIEVDTGYNIINYTDYFGDCRPAATPPCHAVRTPLF